MDEKALEIQSSYPNGSCNLKFPLPFSSMRTRLIEGIQTKMQNTVDSSEERMELLKQLFADIVLEVDNRAKALLYCETVTATTSATSPSTLHLSGKSGICFYEIISEHYRQCPQDAESLLPIFTSLWSLSFTSQIFTLLLHKWFFLSSTVNSQSIKRYSQAVINGSERLLWIDLNSNIHRFKPLYLFLLDEVVLKSNILSKFPAQNQKEFIRIISRFFYFYVQSERTNQLFKHLHQHISFFFSFGFSASDFFVSEITQMLSSIKIELVLLHYLRCLCSLKGVELRTSTSIRFQVCLYSLTRVGGPFFPTRTVRHSARAALDTLFPVGRHMRYLTSLLCRFWYPFYWPRSIFHFFKTSFTSISIICMKMIKWPFQRNDRHLHNS